MADGVCWKPESGSNGAPVAAPFPVPPVPPAASCTMRTRHFPPSTAARTLKAPSADVYEKDAGFVASSWRAASGGAISFSNPTTCAAVSGDFVTARAPPCSSSFARSASSSVRASARLLIITERSRSSCAMSSQLADTCDEGSVHETELLSPEHREEALRVVVEKVEQTGLVSPFLERHEAADRGTVGESDLHTHRAVRHLRDLLVLQRRRFQAAHVRLRDEENFLLVPEERKERLIVVEQIDRLFRMGRKLGAVPQEHIAIQPSAVDEDDADGAAQLLDAIAIDGVHGGRNALCHRRPSPSSGHGCRCNSRSYISRRSS